MGAGRTGKVLSGKPVYRPRCTMFAVMRLIMQRLQSSESIRTRVASTIEYFEGCSTVACASS